MDINRVHMKYAGLDAEDCSGLGDRGTVGVRVQGLSL